MNRILLTAVTALALTTISSVAVGAIAPGAASAQDVQITGPLAGQPAVRHLRQYRVNRFFVTPSVGYTLQDEFSRALFFGGSLGYHFTDWLGISAWGAAAPLDIDTDLTTQIARNGQVTDRNRLDLPTAGNFPDQVGRMRWGVALQAVFIPLRGKLSLFQAAFVDTDLYILAGVALFGLQERSDVPADANPCSGMSTTTDVCAATQTATTDRLTPAPMLGLGLSMYFNEFIGLQFEWRAFPFSWRPSGFDESGEDANGQPGSGFPDGAIDGDDSRTTFNHMFNIGLVIYLPTEVQVSD
ncbi:MAG: outer membrane beta-barrel domain-containing protein [Myxococcota bacterium]|nr:outer membrane beta-barrel domain-containing protein [Myxococcota bacterium]